MQPPPRSAPAQRYATTPAARQDAPQANRYSAHPTAFPKIGDHGIVGNQSTVALIGKDGSVDWMCFPFMDSPSVFAALLDDERGGRFVVQPDDAWDSVQDYVAQTNILRTRFRTRTGELEVTDFMPLARDTSGEPAPTRLVRRVACLSGSVRVRVRCEVRFDYARQRPSWHAQGPRRWVMASDVEGLELSATRDLTWHEEQAQIPLQANETLWLQLTGVSASPAHAETLSRLLEETRSYWVGWTRSGLAGKYPTYGFWQEPLERSALVMKLLQFEETGAIAAAPTTSLPAIVYGTRNWDYRFSWIRDTSMTLYALAELGHVHEMGSYLTWIKAICSATPVEQIGVVYRLREPSPPGDEEILEHLSGYKGSAPVRVGQFVIHQRQHDVYGELLDTLFVASRFVGKIDLASWRMIAPVVEHVCRIWRGKDDGIWEMRSTPRHYTHSKLMCWVALDRGIKIAEHYGLPADLERWRAEREAIRNDILERGYNRERQRFTQHYETDAVDAALLLIPLMGFLPIGDPRVSATIRAIEEDLITHGLVQRYRVDDGLPGQEQGFLICLFWYLNCLIQQRRLDEVEDYLRRVRGYANHLGLFGEQFDPRYQEIVGNFPQAYSHIGYALTVLNYLDARQTSAPPAPHRGLARFQLVLRPRLLNPNPAEQVAIAPANPAEQMRQAMNVLRGFFYDGHRQRIAYERFKGSEYYGVFQEAVTALRGFDPNTLGTDAERTAFWLNVYNAFVIHGVVELGISRSVREVLLFFSRMRYQIGDALYSPDDIEHGILRGNARPPKRLRRQFGPTDPRLPQVVQSPDPRIHFALVCASRSCPPIDAYHPDRLDAQLEASAQVFINASTRLDRARRTLAVSKIFHWYRTDFRREPAALVRYIASYLYDRADTAWLQANAKDIRMAYAPYDWRLNR
jgi:GH15 family glucan-1,4-alpha-glucosidase